MGKLWKRPAEQFPLANVANKADAENTGWQAYIDTAEQAAHAEALAGMLSGMQAVQKTAESVAPEAKLAQLRTGFENVVAKAAPPLASVTTAPFDKNGVKGLWFIPQNGRDNQILLYFHGGAYAFGSSMTSAAVASYLAQQSGIIAFSPDYPLAPEFPYPAALDYAVKAYLTLLDQGFTPDNIVLAGDSAGGGLALAVLLRLRDSSLPMPAGAYLLSPWTDLSCSFPSHKLKQSVEFMLDSEMLHNLAAMYAGNQDLQTPAISPAFADLHGISPLLIQVGTHEIVLDDALTIARNAALADIPMQLTVWPGYFHVFQMLYGKLKGGRKALNDGAAFFRKVMEQ